MRDKWCKLLYACLNACFKINAWESRKMRDTWQAWSPSSGQIQVLQSGTCIINMLLHHILQQPIEKKLPKTQKNLSIPVLHYTTYIIYPSSRCKPIIFLEGGKFNEKFLSAGYSLFRYVLTNFYFSPNDSPSKTTEYVFYFI